MLSVDDYKPGDKIEISNVQAHLVDLTVFFGGYSLISSEKSMQLITGKRYMFDGSQHLFVISNVKAEEATEKPYFSFDFIKNNDGNKDGYNSVDDLETDS